jgi:hypothetical protein
MRRKNVVQPGDFKYLSHQTRQAADADLSPFVTQLLGNLDDRTKPHAADICELAQVEDNTTKPL